MASPAAAGIVYRSGAMAAMLSVAARAEGLPGESYEGALGAFERSFLSAALDRNGGNQSAAARELGITERHLRSRIERLGLRR